LRRNFDAVIVPTTDETFSSWVLSLAESAVSRQQILDTTFKGLHFVGKRGNGGIIIEDKNLDGLVEITINKSGVKCSHDKKPCEHMLFAAMHPLFTE
jgi:hypothetical protein